MRAVFKFLPVLLLLLLAEAAARADQCLPVESKGRFLRIVRDANKTAKSLDTSIITYAPAAPDGDGITVDLIGAMHIAEADYYETLNKKFTTYDALLFELIAPKDLKAAQETSGGNILSYLQQTLKKFLKLEFQLEHIDYRKANFVHADMSPEEFAQNMQDRGESILGIFIKLMLKSSELQRDNPGMAPEVALMQMLMDPNQKISMRTVLAEQFEDLDTLTQILDGEEGSTIISDRNKVALNVLRREIAKGTKRFGIFYGAGHMPDMEKRLMQEFGLVCKGQEWVIAWKLS